MVNVLDQQKHLNDMCGTIEIPFVSVVPFPSAIVTARAGEQSRTNDLLYNKGLTVTFSSRKSSLYAPEALALY